jgi:hypothetical protein
LGFVRRRRNVGKTAFRSKPPKTKRSRSRRSRPVSIREIGIKGLIGFLLVADGILVVFAVRQCSNRGPETVDRSVRNEWKQPVPIQVEVLNGCGEGGIAIQFTDFLRSKGFDVVRMGNYDSYHVPKTMVIERRGIRENGLKVARALGCDDGRILLEIEPDSPLDVRVILGSDYRELECWQTMERRNGNR